MPCSFPFVTSLLVCTYVCLHYFSVSSANFHLNTNNNTREIWRLYTHSYFHSSWLHVSLNCAIIAVFGTITEFELGKLRFLSIHLVTVFNGAFFTKYESEITNEPITLVGSSSFSLGLVGAVVAFLIVNWRRLPIEKKLIYSISFFAILGEIINDAYMITTEQNMYDDIKTSYSAHAGGFLAGVLAAAALSDAENIIAKAVRMCSTILLLTMFTIGLTFFMVG